MFVLRFIGLKCIPENVRLLMINSSVNFILFVIAEYFATISHRFHKRYLHKYLQITKTQDYDHRMSDLNFVLVIQVSGLQDLERSMYGFVTV